MLKPFKIIRRLGTLSGILFLIFSSSPFSFSEDIRYQAGDRRDPFIPINQTPVVTAESVLVAAGIQIEGIIYEARGNSMVVIHGETYKVGDTVENQQIIAIHSSSIVVMVQGSEREYWIPGADPKLIQKDQA